MSSVSAVKPFSALRLDAVHPNEGTESSDHVIGAQDIAHGIPEQHKIKNVPIRMPWHTRSRVMRKTMVGHLFEKPRLLNTFNTLLLVCHCRPAPKGTDLNQLCKMFFNRLPSISEIFGKKGSKGKQKKNTSWGERSGHLLTEMQNSCCEISDAKIEGFEGFNFLSPQVASKYRMWLSTRHARNYHVRLVEHSNQNRMAIHPK